MPIPGLTEGRVVHFVLDSGRNKGEHRAATVVRVFEGDEAGCNLHVHLDNMNDDPMSPYPQAHIVWMGSIKHDEDKKPGTWHWIERA